jgi:hypothetical protein
MMRGRNGDSEVFEVDLTRVDVEPLGDPEGGFQKVRVTAKDPKDKFGGENLFYPIPPKGVDQ